MKFKKKPVVIDAEQLTWGNWNTICDFIAVGLLSDGKAQGCYVDDEGKVTSDTDAKLGLQIPTLEGVMLSVEGDWIIKGVEGEFYSCKKDIFTKTYERVEEE